MANPLKTPNEDIEEAVEARIAQAIEALDELGAAFRDKGITLADFIESGAQIREVLVREMYGNLGNP
ncbi:MAG: hypothetical protein IT307_06030 [Chloroflexi bacterium]|nr:hypothetical protein [Chloroflexota bacterium]